MPVYEIRMVASKLSDAPTTTARNAENSAQYLIGNCYNPDEMWREKAFAVFTDSRCNVKGHLLLSVGGTKSTSIDVKLIAKGALDLMADGVILSHNHPTGDPTPSQDDLKQTDKVKKALACLDIKLLDHVILGEGKAFSMCEERTFSI